MCAVCLGRWAEPHIKNCSLAARNKRTRSSTIGVMCLWLFFFFWKFDLIPDFFFFFGTTLPWVLVDVFRESSLRQKTFAHSGGSTAMKTSGNQPPGFRLSRRQRVPAHHRVLCSVVQDQQNKYALIATCVVGGKKKIKTNSDFCIWWNECASLKPCKHTHTLHTPTRYVSLHYWICSLSCLKDLQRH